MSLLAVTVIGHDRPGIIATVTGELARLGGNLEDSTMTLLRGHFAMMLVVATESPRSEVNSALEQATAGSGLLVSVAEVSREPEHTPSGGTHLLTVHGADRPGIVSALTHEIAAVDGNIVDLATRLAGSLYVLVAEVELPDSVNPDVLAGRLADVGRTLGVEATLRHAEGDLL